MWWALKRRIHISWYIAAIGGGIGVGTTVAIILPRLSDSGAIIAVAGILLVGVGFWRRYIWLIPFACIGGMCLGLWRGNMQRVALDQVRPFYHQAITVTGSVPEDPDGSAPGTFAFRLVDLKIEGRLLPGTMRVTVAGYTKVQRGNVVTVRGKLAEGTATIIGSMFRAQVVNLTDPYPGDVARRIRDWFGEAVRKAIPDPQASLGLGYLVGQKSALPPDLKDALQIAGLTHIVVASGYNLTILVRLSRRILARVSKFTAFLGSILLVVCMMSVTGLSPSMTRAGLVTGLSLVTWYYGRNFHPLILLPFAAAITTMIQPEYAWGDVGWLLSFTAFAGVMIIAPLLQRFFFGEKEPGVMRQVLGETIAAHIATLPVLMVVFSQVSNVAIPANMMIVPLVPLAMLLTFIAGVGVLIFPPAAPVIGLPATWLLSYMIAAAQWWADLPWALSEFIIQPWMAGVMYLLIALGCILLARLTHYSFRATSIIE